MQSAHGWIRITRYRRQRDYLLNIMINGTIKAVAEPKPHTGVVLWRMKPTSFFVRRFSAPGGYGHREVWEEEFEKLKKV